MNSSRSPGNLIEVMNRCDNPFALIDSVISYKKVKRYGENIDCDFLLNTALKEILAESRQGYSKKQKKENVKQALHTAVGRYMILNFF